MGQCHENPDSHVVRFNLERSNESFLLDSVLRGSYANFTERDGTNVFFLKVILMVEFLLIDNTGEKMVSFGYFARIASVCLNFRLGTLHS